MNDLVAMKRLEQLMDIVRELIDDEEVSEPFVEAILIGKNAIAQRGEKE